MTSTFERVVKSVVRELDPKGDLIPVDSLRSSTSFRPYCLLGRKLSSSWFWKPRYKCLNLSIKDILEPDAPEPAVERVASFHIEDLVDGMVQGNVEVKALGQGKFVSGAAVSATASTSMDVCVLKVPLHTWGAMNKERRLRQPEHNILQQLRSCGSDVFVVTEVLQTQEEVEVTRAQKQEGCGQFALPGVLRVQGKGQGHLNRKKTVTIPSGSVLAFQTALLVIGPDWEIHHLQHKDERTFRLPKTGHKPTSSTGLLSQIPLSYFKMRFPSTPVDMVSDGDIEDQMPVTEDFQGLKVEVSVHADGLKGLSGELCGQILAGLMKVLREEPALESLQEELEQGLCCGWVASPDAPGGAILECLVQSSGKVEEELARPILYLVQALTELNETQRALLAEALETGDLSGQSRLVQSVLEQSSPWKEHRAVSLPQELLGSSWDSKAPAWVLLEECGLELQVDVPQVHWQPDAQGRTSALYACLVLLPHLSQDSA
ncbi:gasdermin-D [Panthera pardus]|uniref:Gasdermin-D n=1 Tax=Panthera pardus TaxID=9691 RepID=A0A9W2V0Z4_PANPR|nr:gasdermin-D [Panthera pardus]